MFIFFKSQKSMQNYIQDDNRNIKILQSYFKILGRKIQYLIESIKLTIKNLMGKWEVESFFQYEFLKRWIPLTMSHSLCTWSNYDFKQFCSILFVSFHKNRVGAGIIFLSCINLVSFNRTWPIAWEVVEKNGNVYFLLFFPKIQAIRCWKIGLL